MWERWSGSSFAMFGTGCGATLCLVAAFAWAFDFGPPPLRARSSVAEPLMPPAAPLPAEINSSPDPTEIFSPEFRAAGVDVGGAKRRLPLRGDAPALVVVFLATDCPISNGSLPALARLAERFSGSGVEFCGVISDPGVTRAEAVRHRDEYGIAFPVLFDADGQLRARFRPTHVPQVFVLDRRGDVRYSGRTDDQYAGLGRPRREPRQPYLERAISSLLEGRPVDVPRTKPVGCLLESDGSDGRPAAVTYNRHIAPIIHNHCLACHRDGEVAPFPLASYEDVSRRAGQIVLVVRERIMPPWKPEHGFGHFRDERRLSGREIELLEAWAASGKPRGDADDLPPAPTFPGGWQLGEPDLVLELAESFDVPADGPDIYQTFVIPTGLARDRLIAAIEYRPGNPRVVHHASFCYDTGGAARRLDEAESGPGYRQSGGAWGFVPDGTLGGWGPGVRARRLPEGTGRPIRAGADLVIQSHYHPSGKPERDRPEVGIYFAPDEARQEVVELIVCDFELHIPAGSPRHRHDASYVLPVDVTLLTVTPHMHLLGREITAAATLPDGRVEPLVRIADWDFNWHDHYVYDRPLRLPAGTRIDVTCRYDNSAVNPLNPYSPPRPVDWGEGTFDEMGVCYFDVLTDTPADRDRLVSDNRAQLLKSLQALNRSKADASVLPPDTPESPAESAPGNPANPR